MLWKRETMEAVIWPKVVLCEMMSALMLSSWLLPQLGLLKALRSFEILGELPLNFLHQRVGGLPRCLGDDGADCVPGHQWQGDGNLRVAVIDLWLLSVPVHHGCCPFSASLLRAPRRGRSIP